MYTVYSVRSMTSSEFRVPTLSQFNTIANNPPYHRNPAPNPHRAREGMEPAYADLVEEREGARRDARSQKTPH